METTILGFVEFLIAFVVVLSVHEASHAMIAYFLGDPTAKVHGRLSLNPVRHIDIVGFLMLMFVHIGWGKPVPINPSNFKHPVRDSALTALAGPVSNFVLALVFGVLIKYLGGYLPGFVVGQLWWIFDLSVVWGIFNLFPVPPLDGGKILGLIMPRKYAARYMAFQDRGLLWFAMFMLIDIFVIEAIFGVSIVKYIVFGAYEFVRNVILFGV